jgi:hypothetical protein
MDRTWDSIKRGFQDGATAAALKAGELTRIGRARLDMAAAKTRLSRLHTELGTGTFLRLEEGRGAELADDPEILDLCRRIREAADALRDSEAAYEQVRSEAEEAEEAPEPEAGPEAEETPKPE